MSVLTKNGRIPAGRYPVRRPTSAVLAVVVAPAGGRATLA